MQLKQKNLICKMYGLSLYFFIDKDLLDNTYNNNDNTYMIDKYSGLSYRNREIIKKLIDSMYKTKQK